MKNLVIVIQVFILVLSCAGAATYATKSSVDQLETVAETVMNHDHSAWDALLKKYVAEDGAVDYDGFKKDEKALKMYLVDLGSNPINKQASKNERLAYYINLYNASIIEIIIDNDQPESIKDLGSFLSPVWKKDFIKVGDELWSLDNIEKGVLQKMGDPRIHFAINCASYSCPKLQNQAFTSENMDSLMNKAAGEFINSDKNDLSDPDNPKLSEIFKWYRSDFTNAGMTIIEYVNKYAETKISDGASIDYLDYDWSLNKQS